MFVLLLDRPMLWRTTYRQSRLLFILLSYMYIYVSDPEVLKDVRADNALLWNLLLLTEVQINTNAAF